MATNLIGTNQDQVPTNGYLGNLAYKDSDAPFYAPLVTLQSAPTLASSATIAPVNLVNFVSGTTTINTITVPQAMLSTGGQLTLIPTGLWSTGTSGNIALATTGVVSKALIMTYDAVAAKWYPSY